MGARWVILGLAIAWACIRPAGRGPAANQTAATQAGLEFGPGDRLLTQQPDGVAGADFSPDGKWLAFVGADKAVRVWDVAAGKEVRRLDGHTGFIRTVAFPRTASSWPRRGRPGSPAVGRGHRQGGPPGRPARGQPTDGGVLPGREGRRVGRVRRAHRGVGRHHRPAARVVPGPPAGGVRGRVLARRSDPGLGRGQGRVGAPLGRGHRQAGPLLARARPVRVRGRLLAGRPPLGERGRGRPAQGVGGGHRPGGPAAGRAHRWREQGGVLRGRLDTGNGQPQRNGPPVGGGHGGGAAPVRQARRLGVGAGVLPDRPAGRLDREGRGGRPVGGHAADGPVGPGQGVVRGRTGRGLAQT